MKLETYLKQAALTALLAFACIASSIMPMNSALATRPESTKATIVLVHGAFADSSSWDGVISRLQANGYTVIAAANPLRGLMSDSDYVGRIVSNVKGPVVLVGHSYGGMVITNATSGTDNVRALVYVDAYAPEARESAFELTAKFPGSILAGALAAPITLLDGNHDLNIEQDKFGPVFAADLPEKQVELLAATQRPVEDVALNDRSGAPAWKSIPSWFVYGDADKVIPPAAHAFMAQRAHSKDTLVVKGASHVALISHPSVVANLIERAATATTD